MIGKALGADDRRRRGRSRYGAAAKALVGVHHRRHRAAARSDWRRCARRAPTGCRTSLNLALGSALASIGLTIPAVADRRARHRRFAADGWGCQRAAHAYLLGAVAVHRRGDDVVRPDGRRCCRRALSTSSIFATYVFDRGGALGRARSARRQVPARRPAAPRYCSRLDRDISPKPAAAALATPWRRSVASASIADSPGGWRSPGSTEAAFAQASPGFRGWRRGGQAVAHEKAHHPVGNRHRCGSPDRSRPTAAIGGTPGIESGVRRHMGKAQHPRRERRRRIGAGQPLKDHRRRTMATAPETAAASRLGAGGGAGDQALQGIGTAEESHRRSESRSGHRSPAPTPLFIAS